jgi:hypothetical protein
VIRDRFVAVFRLGPTARGCRRLWRALAISLAGLLASPCALTQTLAQTLAQSASETRITPLGSRTLSAAAPKPAPDPLLADSADPDPATGPALGATEAEDGAEDGEAPIRAAYTAEPDPGPDPADEGLTPVDGVVLADGSVPRSEGIAALGAEPRTAEDIAAFQLPPAGYDPYMFRIEPEPLRDRRPAELFHIEPYDPTGVRLGGFVIFPEAEISGLATNNVFKSPVRQGDAALDVRSSVRAVTDWYRHALEFRAAGGASFFAEHPSEDDRAYALEARGRLDITPRTNLEALLSHQRDKDIRSAPNVPIAAAERGDLEVDRAAVAFNHRFNRLSFQLRAAIREFDFAPVPSLGGGIISNDARDYLERDAALRTTWDFGGGFGVFVETAIDDRSYHTPPADGISRSSTGEQYRAGVSFAPLGNTVRGEVSLGWGRQRPNVAQLPDLDGVLIDANLAWRASALTTFLFTAQSTFIDSIAVGSSGGLARQLGFEVRHAFWRRLIGNAGLRYTSTPYEGINVIERELVAELGLDYYVGRDTILFGRYQHIAFDSTQPASDSDADVLRLGVRVRY